MKNLKFRKTVILFFIISCMMSFFASCNFFSSFYEKEDSEITITGLSMSKSEVSVSVGEMVYITVNVKPTEVQKNVKLVWSFDNEIISADTSSSWGITLTGLKEGQTSLKCSYGGYEATCIVTVQGHVENYKETVEPYIYSNTTIIQTAPGVSEKVFVSLYGGSVADIGGYSWTVDNPSVASIEPTGQYCIVTAKGSGYARIKITHSKAAYPYYMGVYVFEDPSKMTYITTSNNILTMNLDGGDENVSVSLVNKLETSRDSDFKWELINETSDAVPVSYISNGNQAVITPKTSGYCTIRVTHPDAVYPLDITCRVITVVKNVYIEPDSTVVTLEGEEEKSVTSKLINTDSQEAIYSDYDYKILNTEIAEITASVGNTVYVKGLRNGSTKLIISHPKAAYSREVLLISNNQIADAVDASCYITTSNNYIRTKVGNSPSEVNVMLKGGEEGDEKDFNWTIENYAADGSSESVITLETPTGNDFVARKASQTYAFGNAYITPQKEGSAVIKITHPKVLYPTEILVKVLSEDAILTESLYFKGDGLIRMLNGTSFNYKVTLSGSSKRNSDNSDISWSIDDSRFVLNANEDTAEINAPSLGTGSTVSHLTISHPKADVAKNVVIITADDEETLMNMKVLYTDKDYYNIEVGSTLNLHVDSLGFYDTFNSETGENIPYDFSMLKWSVDKAGIIDYSCNESTDKRNVNIQALKSGIVKLKAFLEDCECIFTINVYPVGALQTEPEVYFTTNSNVVHIENPGDTASVNISAINLSSREYSNITWNSDDSSIASLISNGTKCVINAVSEGQTVINVSHPDSQNVLKIYVRVGSEYIHGSENSSAGSLSKGLIPYIKAPNVVSLLKSDSPKKITVSLADYTGMNADTFCWSISDELIARFSAVSVNGTAYVKGINSGSTEITVSNSETDVQKKILVVVGETEEEIVNILSHCYFTASNNVVFLEKEGDNTVVKISAMNIKPEAVNDIVWTSLDESVCSVIGNGTSATIMATGNGKTTVYATYKNSLNGIAFYVYVSEKTNEGNSSSGSGSGTSGGGSSSGTGTNGNVPYISVQNVFTIQLDEADKKFSATLSGYNGNDVDGFSFSIADTKVAKIASWSANGTAYIAPVSTGYTELTVSHVSTGMTKKVLVAVAESDTETVENLSKIMYLSIPSNVVSLSDVGKSSVIQISAMNVQPYDYHNITWISSNESVCSVIGNGTSASVTANGEGRAFITASYHGSINSLKIYVFVGKSAIDDVINGNSSSSEGGNSEGSGGSGSGSTGGTGGSGSSGGSGTGGSGSGSTSSEVSENVVTSISSVNVLTLVAGEESRILTAVISNKKDYEGLFNFRIADESIARISGQSSNGTAYIAPVQEGITEVTITNTATTVEKKVLIVVGSSQKNVAETVSKTVYMTTNNNVAVFDSLGEIKSVGINAVNLDSSLYSEITWSSSDNSVVSVIPNGNKASIKSEGEGAAFVTASYENSSNCVTFYVFVGNKAVDYGNKTDDSNNTENGSGGSGSGSGSGTSSGETGTGGSESGNSSSDEADKAVTSITSVNVLTLVTGEESRILTAVLSNKKDYEGLFSFRIADETIAKIAGQSSNGTAYIAPVREGITEVTITNTATAVEKKVLIVVGSSQKSVAETVSKTVYMTTSKNYLSFGSLNQVKDISVSLNNVSAADLSDIKWSSSNSSVASVIANGNKASVKSLGYGQAVITATFQGSKNEISFYVSVYDETLSASAGGSSGESGTGTGGTSSGETGTGGSGSGSSGSGNGNTENNVNTQTKTAYISSVGVLALTKDESDKILSASLNNYNGVDSDGFKFTIADTKIAKIASQSTNGLAYIKPVSVGYTEITISHKACDITKKVLVVVGENETALVYKLESLKYLTTQNNVLSFDDVKKSASLTINAVNVPSYDYSNIEWASSDESICSVISNGTSATVISNGEGKAFVYARYADSVNELTFHVFVGKNAIQAGSGSSSGNSSSGGGNGGNGSSSNPETGGNSSSGNDVVTVLPKSARISSVNVLTLSKTDSEKMLQASLVGEDDSDGFKFSVADTKIAKFASQSTNGTAFIKPVSVGYTEITISHKNTDVIKKVLVVVGENEAAAVQSLSAIKYLSTSSNVINFEEPGKNKNISVSANNIFSSDFYNINWKSSDESVCSVIGNGITATVTANGEGRAFVYASHADSVNTLTFHVFVGKKENQSGGGNTSGNTGSGGSSSSGSSGSSSSGSGSSKIAYISSVNVLTIAKNEPSKMMTATLVDYNGVDSDGFKFSVADTKVAKIDSQSTNGTVFIKPVSVGFTELTVSHKATNVTKKVLLAVGETEAEAAEFIADKKYLSIPTNSYFISSGDRITVKVTANNMTSYEAGLCKWKVSGAASCVSVLENGNQAVIQGISGGESVITVSHQNSINEIKIYVFVDDKNESSSSSSGSSGSGSSGGNGSGTNSLPEVYISAQDVLTLQKGDQPYKLQSVLVNYNGTDSSGFTFEIDNTSVASISAQSTNGTAFIKPVNAGQAEITISHIATSFTKKVLVVVGESEEESNTFTYLTTGSNVVAVSEGNTKTVSVSIKNSDEVIIDGYTWISSDPDIVSVVSQGTTAVFTGNSIGTAIITVSNKNCKYPLQIIAQVVNPIAAATNPYIQLTSSVITVPVSSTYISVTAELVGGSESDYSDFIWQSNDSSICVVYGQNEVGKIRALKEGTAYVTVSHPKAAYSAQILVVCDKVTETECYISVPSSIINMKPTDSSQTITASLINGTSTDKYNFTWSLDVYDVIDFVYSANVCTIEPKQQGQATITIHHPKSAYDQQIVVTVQEYSNFAFPNDYITVTQGTVSFKAMQIPNTKVSTYVEYSTSDSTICNIAGTKTTAQITAIKTGTANVYAKLIASSTGVVQATAEMMIYVKEAPINANYITSSSTIYTLNKGKSQTLSATLIGSGIVTSDQQNLKWTTSDTDIISIAGISKDGTVTGQSIYITANKSGEALITCSHEKAESMLQFYVVVPGAAAKTVKLNKSYITLTKGSSGTTLRATIENAESSNDYNKLDWSVSNTGDDEVCRVMGNGQDVTIYPVNVGMAEVMVQLPDSDSVAKCTVLVQAGKSFVFEQNTVTVQPFKTKKIKYTVSPPDANLTWTMNQSDGDSNLSDAFSYQDLKCDANGVGYVQINGLSEGGGNLYCVTDGNAKGNLSIKVTWNYLFRLDTQRISTKPGQKFSVKYYVNPTESLINVEGTEDIFKYSITEVTDKDYNGIIEFTALKEGETNLIITATNPNAKYEVIGEASIKASSLYSNLTVTPTLSSVSIANGEKAYYSRIDGNSIYLGDGEKVTITFECEETGVEPKYILESGAEKLGYDDESGKKVTLQVDDKTGEGMLTITSCKEYTEPCYYIQQIKKPTYKKSSNYNDGSPIKYEDFEFKADGSKECSDCTYRDGVGKHQAYDRTCNIFLKNKKNNSIVWTVHGYGDKIRNTSNYVWAVDPTKCNGRYYIRSPDLWWEVSTNEDWGYEISDEKNFCMDVEEFRKNAWFYIPEGLKVVSGSSYGENVGIETTEGRIDTRHVIAKYLSNSIDTGIHGNVSCIGTIRIDVEHGTKTDKVTYSVYIEKHKCLCTYDPNPAPEPEIVTDPGKEK